MTDNPFDLFDDEERPAPVMPAPLPAGANPFDVYDEDEEVDAAASRAEAPSQRPQAPSATPQPLPAVPGMGFADNDPALDEALSRLDAQNKRAGTDALNAARGNGFIEGLLDPQQYAETAKGVVPGAIKFGGTTLKGAAGIKAAGEANAAAFGRGQLDIFDRIDRGEAVAEMDDPAGYQHMNADQRQTVRADVERAAAGYTPTPAHEQSLYQAGEAVTEYAKTVLPAAPGYDQAVGRQLGEGIGSLVAGLPAGFLGRIPAAVFFGAGGSGEAVERAIEFDRKERAAGRAGLTQDQINVASLWGVAPGTTDLLPVETLLGRLKIPQPFARFGARAIGRIGGQAFVEGMQEGGQSYLQNLIAREIYAPEQALAEGILPSAGLGAGVGGLAQSAQEIARLMISAAAGRRARNAPFPGDQIAAEDAARDAAGAETAPPSPAAPEAPVPATEDAGQRGVDVLQFIRAKGGLKPSGELDAVDAKRYPGLVSAKGLDADKMREAMVEAGYLVEAGPDAPAVTTPQDVFDLVGRAIGGERIVPIADREADAAFTATQAARDETREFEAGEQQFTIPEIERYDAEFGEPVLRQAYDRLDETSRREVIDRNRRGEDVADLIEEMAIRAEDAPTLAAMVVKRGLPPEQAAEIREVVAREQPELLASFDALAAQMPKRRAKSRGAPSEQDQLLTQAAWSSTRETFRQMAEDDLPRGRRHFDGDSLDAFDRMARNIGDVIAASDQGDAAASSAALSAALSDAAELERLRPGARTNLYTQYVRQAGRQHNVAAASAEQPGGEFSALTVPASLPTELPGEGPVILTDAAEQRRGEMQAAVDEAAAKILPQAVRVQVVNSIALAKQHQDDLLALRMTDEQRFREGRELLLPYAERWGNPRFDPADKQRALDRIAEIGALDPKTAAWADLVAARNDLREISSQLLYYNRDVTPEQIETLIDEVWHYGHEKRFPDEASEMRPSIFSATGLAPEVAAIADAMRPVLDRLYGSKRAGLSDMMLIGRGDEPARRKKTGPEPERIGEARGGFYFKAGRELENVPDALFRQGGQAVIDHLSQAGVKKAEIKHFGLEALAGKKRVTREEFAQAIAERVFEFRRKTSWFNPEANRMDYETGGTRAFSGPRIPGRGVYFERLMAFPKKLKGGEEFAPGHFQSPHWEEELAGTWASWRGSVRDVPGWGKMVVGEEGQTDLMQGATARNRDGSLRRPRVKPEEFLKKRAEGYTAFTPETPIDDSYVRTMARDLLLQAAAKKADSIAISTSDTTARIQNTDRAAHFYDAQMRPALERELRRITGDGSLKLEKVALPKPMGGRREKPYTVWAAKLSKEAVKAINEEGQPLFARPATLHNTTLSTRAADEMASIRTEIDNAVAKSLPPGWRAEVRQSLVFGDLSERIQKRNPGVPPSLEIEGTFDPYERIIYVSMAALDPVERAYEEAGHAIKAMRLIPEADYGILQAKAAEIGARQKFRIDERYADVYGARWKDDPARLEEALEEEAIMQMVAARARGDDFGKQSNAILDKLVKFLRAIRDMLGLKGFRTFEDVFEDMTEGGFARQMDAQRGLAGPGGQTKPPKSAMLRAAEDGGMNESLSETGAPAGREGGPLGAGEPAPGALARLGEGGPDDRPGTGDAGFSVPTGDRIVRQASARFDGNGEVIVGRRSREGGAEGGGAQGDDPQRIGGTEPFRAGKYEGRVTALPLKDADIPEGNLARLKYELESRRTGGAAGHMDLVQRADGAWEVDFVEVAARGAGVGKQLYNAVERDLGIKMSPSGILSDEGLAFWSKRSPASVQWHARVGAFHYSPRKISNEIANVGREIGRLSKAEGTAANIPDGERTALIAKLQKDRTRLIAAFGKLPPEARTRETLDTMFAIREPESPTATDASFIARAEAMSEIMFALGDEGKGKTPEGKSTETGGEAKPAPSRAAAAPSPSAPAKTSAPILPGGRESKRIRNLINQAAAEGKLPREDAQALIERYDALEQFHKDGGKAKQQIAKELTAEAEHRKRQKGLAEIAKRKIQSAMISFRDARGQADPAKAMQALIENLGQHELPQGMVSVANHQHAIFGVAMAELDGVLHAFRKTFVTGQTRNKARLSNVVRELFGEKTDDEMAAGFATAAGNVMENLRLRFNHAGGAIGQRKNWGLPQWHDQVALIRAKKPAWIEFVEPLLDPKSLKHPLTGDPLAPADVKAMLSDVWDTIASDGWHEKEAEMGRRGLSAIANTRGDPRSLVFANADAWMKYSERFGGGPDALGIIVGHIKSMSRDIAAMEVLGPNPANMLKYMQDFVSQQAKLRRAGMTAVFPQHKEISGRAFADPTSYAKMMNDRAENMWNIYSGRASAPVNAVMAEYSQGVRNINVFTKLGGAAVSGLGDLAWQVIARKFAGLPVTRMAKDILDQIKPGGEREARRAGVIAESYMHMHNEGAREGAALSFTGVTNYLSERVLTLSMLNGVTRAGNHAMGMGIQGHFADLTGKAFAELTPQIQRTLRRWGLDAADWEAMRLDASGRPREVDFLSPVEIRNSLAAGGGDPAIAERYLAMIIGESQYATLTGTIRGQAMMRGGTRAGTSTGELIRHLGQFKTFAVNLYILQIERMAREFVSQGLTRGAQYAALVLAVAVAGGAMVEQLQQLRNFKDPRDMTTPEFWGAALYRSGGLSIWGDLLYATETRYGAGLAGVVAGPTTGTATDFAHVTYGALTKRLFGTDEKTNFGREFTNVVRRYTPGASLWYVRAAWERVVMDNLQRMLDPQAEASFRRKIQNAKRDYKQDFWWKPGTSAPQRGPRLGAAFPLQ